MSFYPGYKFARAEWFGDVIVAADLKAENAINLIGTRGEKNDRNAGEFSACANAAAEFESVVTWEHDVEDDEIGVKKLERCERTILTTEDARLETGLGEVVLDERGELGFVLNNGYLS